MHRGRPVLRRRVHHVKTMAYVLSARSNCPRLAAPAAMLVAVQHLLARGAKLEPSRPLPKILLPQKPRNGESCIANDGAVDT